MSVQPMTSYRNRNLMSQALKYLLAVTLAPLRIIAPGGGDADHHGARKAPAAGGRAATSTSRRIPRSRRCSASNGAALP